MQLTPDEEVIVTKIMMYGHTPRQNEDNNLWYVVHVGSSHDEVGNAIERLHLVDNRTFGAKSLADMLKYVEMYYARHSGV